jgi:hypothetical protein
MKRNTFTVALKVLSVIFLILLVKILAFGGPSNNKIELIILYILASLVILGWIFIVSKNRKAR